MNTYLPSHQPRVVTPNLPPSLASLQVTLYLVQLILQTKMRKLTISRCAPSIARSFRLFQPLSSNYVSHYVRQFTATPYRSIAVAEMTDNDLKSLKVKKDRLMEDIHSTCEWGKGERWGE